MNILRVRQEEVEMNTVGICPHTSSKNTVESFYCRHLGDLVMYREVSSFGTYIAVSSIQMCPYFRDVL